jgi:hypothetical protein
VALGLDVARSDGALELALAEVAHELTMPAGRAFRQVCGRAGWLQISRASFTLPYAGRVISRSVDPR